MPHQAATAVCLALATSLPAAGLAVGGQACLEDGPGGRPLPQAGCTGWLYTRLLLLGQGGAEAFQTHIHTTNTQLQKHITDLLSFFHI